MFNHVQYTQTETIHLREVGNSEMRMGSHYILTIRVESVRLVFLKADPIQRKKGPIAQIEISINSQ